MSRILMQREIDLSLLRAFLVIVETKSVTKAAHQLHQTQAAVSHKLKRLEEGLDSTLFDRENKQINLTAAGERLIGHAEKLLALNDETLGMMRAPEVEGVVKLGVPYDLMLPYIPQILKDFNRSLPMVDVTLVSGMTADLKNMVENGDIDLTFGTDIEVEKNAICLMKDSLVWVGAENGVAYARNPLPVSLGGPHCAFRKVTLEKIMEMGLRWRSVSDSEHTAPTFATLQADLAITTMMKSTIPTYLSELPLSIGFPQLPDYYITLLLPKRNATPLALALKNHIEPAFQKLPEMGEFRSKIQEYVFSKHKNTRKKPGSFA